MAEVSDAKWDGSPSNWKDTPSYCDSCAINMNTGDRADWMQDKCKLPFKFPDGAISTVSIATCAAALNGARGGLKDVPADAKKKAARTLISAYREAQMDPPDNLKKMAQ